MQAVFKALVDFISRDHLIISLSKLLLIIVIASISHFLIKKLLRKLPISYAKKIPANIQKVKFLETLIDGTEHPLLVFNWLIAALIFLRSLAMAEDLINPVSLLFSLSIIFNLAWLVWRCLEAGEVYLIDYVYSGDQRNIRQRRTSIMAFGRLFKILLVIVVLLIALQILNINITGILALGGAGTIVIGFAAKELLANLFGCMMIFMDRQFMVGDTIKTTTEKIEGKVEYIGWRLTRIRTLDGALLYVPNSTFLTVGVENSSKRQVRRIREIIRLKYQDLANIEPVLKEILALLKAHPDLDHEQLCFVGIYQFNYMAVDCLLWCFTRSTDLEAYLKVQHDVLCKINTILTNHQIQIAFTSLVDPTAGIVYE